MTLFSSCCVYLCCLCVAALDRFRDVLRRLPLHFHACGVYAYACVCAYVCVCGAVQFPQVFAPSAQAIHRA